MGILPTTRLYLSQMLYADAQAREGVGLLVGKDGRTMGCVAEDDAPAGTEIVRLAGKALLPGLANAHSHTFQRLFRGRAEGRAAGGDTFWTWREQMYRAANFLTPDEIYDVARATFLEMAAAGITGVGEFHYLHGAAGREVYVDANLLSHRVIDAARSVGMRIVLLRTAYFRAGFERAPHEGQRRFYERPEAYLRNLENLAGSYADVNGVSIGAAPHSIRAVPLDELKPIAAFANDRVMPLHMHISEQVGENSACIAEYGTTPVWLMSEHGVLSPRTTLVHATHLTTSEYETVARAGTTICCCPTTERNLGDGIFPADTAARLGIPVAFGTDSQAQIDILEDARQIEYHLRLRDQQRGILDASARLDWATHTSIGEGLFKAASANGYAALGLQGGRLSPGEPADFFTVDLDDPSILGVDPESLTTQAVFALAKGAVRDVAVQGRLILEDGQHLEQESIRRNYKAVQKRFLNF